MYREPELMLRLSECAPILSEFSYEQQMALHASETNPYTLEPKITLKLKIVMSVFGHLCKIF